MLAYRGYPVNLITLNMEQTRYKTPKDTKAQNSLSEARRKLKAEYTEVTQAVVDPSAEKPTFLTGRHRAKYVKLTAADNILSRVAKDPFTSLNSSQQYMLQPDLPSLEPFNAQLEVIARIRAEFGLKTHSSHA